MFDNQIHPFMPFQSLPYCAVRLMVGRMLRSEIPSKFHSKAFIEACIRYWSLMTQRMGKQDVVLLKLVRWLNVLK